LENEAVPVISQCIRQSGLAAQQADAVAEPIAAAAGADIDPQPFRPALRGVLLTGGPPRYLRAQASTDESTVSEEPLWWPPNRLCGRYLAPYLSSQAGFTADVMPQEPPVLVEAGRRPFDELRDLPRLSR
jgi:sulfide:quinone oxidoreductase